MVGKFDAQLVDWALVRVTIGAQVSTHAVGLRRWDIKRSGGYVLTSPVREIDRAGRRLTTQNSVYELVDPVDSYPDDDLAHWAHLVVNRARSAPDRIEWLKSDGSVSRSMDRAEIVAAVEEWRRTRPWSIPGPDEAALAALSADFDRRLESFKTTGIRDRVEGVIADKGHASKRSKAGDSF